MPGSQEQKFSARVISTFRVSRVAKVTESHPIPWPVRFVCSLSFVATQTRECQWRRGWGSCSRVHTGMVARRIASARAYFVGFPNAKVALMWPRGPSSRTCRGPTHSRRLPSRAKCYLTHLPGVTPDSRQKSVKPGWRSLDDEVTLA